MVWYGKRFEDDKMSQRYDRFSLWFWCKEENISHKKKKKTRKKPIFLERVDTVNYVCFVVLNVICIVSLPI